MVTLEFLNFPKEKLVHTLFIFGPRRGGHHRKNWSIKRVYMMYLSCFLCFSSSVERSWGALQLWRPGSAMVFPSSIHISLYVVFFRRLERLPLSAESLRASSRDSISLSALSLCVHKVSLPVWAKSGSKSRYIEFCPNLYTYISSRESVSLSLLARPSLPVSCT